MDTIKAQLLKIQQQLAGLSASQKMLTGCLLAIMVMTMIWWGRYAGTAEMEPVIDATMAPDEMMQVQTALASQGIQYTVVGDRVMIPSDKKVQAISILSYLNALPSGGTNAWDDMIKMMNPWDTAPKSNTILNHLRESTLSQAMTRYFPGVSQAVVFITAPEERRIGTSNEPTASVQLKMRRGTPITQQLVEGVASTVASAVPGLVRGKVSVVVDGALQHVQNADNQVSSGEFYDQIEKLEQRNKVKIEEMMPANSRIAVKVDIDTSTDHLTREAYDPKTSLITPKSEETENRDISANKPAVEPGAASNLELSLNGAGAPGPTNTSERSKTDNAVFPGKTTEVVEKPAGQFSVVSAAIRIPRSYFVKRFKIGANSAAEPDDTALQALVDQATSDFRTAVQSGVGIKNPELVSIGFYDDADTAATVATEAPAQAGVVGTLVNAHGKELVLGALAVVSLFMVSMIVKKGSVVPAMPEPAPARPTPRFGSGEEVAGMAGSDESTPLDAMELDEDSVKAQQVVAQVATMVKEDPDAAANLVKRWMNRT